MQGSTIAAIATPPGRAALLWCACPAQRVIPWLPGCSTRQTRQKKWKKLRATPHCSGISWTGKKPFDEGVALFFRAPHSYTGEDVVELSCHGGNAVARRLVEACLAAGAQPAAPGEYTRRAFFERQAGSDPGGSGHGPDLGRRAAGGQRWQTPRWAVRWRKKINAQKAQLTALQAHLAAWVDFPEEDVPELDPAHLRTVLGAVQQELDALIRSYDAGAVLREGVDCAIVGRPNAGKSTLLNLLAGFDRAIVTPVAGTTRDVVEQAVQLGDIRLNLFDTAGLRETEDAIEAEGIRRSWKKLEEAGLILAVFDGSEPPSREDLALAQRCAGRPAIALVNKEDKPAQFDAELIAPYFAMVLPVCCREEGSRKVIAAAVARLLGTGSIDPPRRQPVRAAAAFCCPPRPGRRSRCTGCRRRRLWAGCRFGLRG